VCDLRNLLTGFCVWIVVQLAMETMRLCRQCCAPLAADAPGWLCPECQTDPARTPPSSATAARAAVPSVAELAPLFPWLEIVGLAGQGGMGIIYKARQPQLDRVVALKILSPELGRDPAFAGRFSREAQALAKLSHSNIVSVFDFGRAGGYYYLLMEYVEGVNLRDWIGGRKLSPEEARRIVIEICDALQFAHEEGIVHRDIKPSNILSDKKGRIKVADFGLARLAGKNRPDSDEREWTNLVLGTPAYMAPEQVERPGQIDHRTDLYSLGIVLYEMLTGQLPVEPFDPPSKRAGVDPRLDTVVIRALEKDPLRRFQHASEFRAAIEKATGPQQLAPVEAAPASTHSAKWKLLQQFGLMAGAALLAVVLYVQFRDHGPDRRPGHIPPGASEALVGAPESIGLDQRIITALHLDEENVQGVNRILRRYEREYAGIERRHTESFKDAAGHVHVTIQPFPQEMDSLMSRMFLDLADVLNGRQLDAARAWNLEGLFPHSGRAPVSVEIWMENGEYHYVEGEGPPGHGGATTAKRGVDMPLRYRWLLPEKQ
jgi:serine/threonine protein kinase